MINANPQVMNILDFLPDAVLIIDIEQKVIAWNRAIEELTMVKREKIIGKGDYCYAELFYGVRKPMLINIVGTILENIGEIACYKYIEQKGDTLYGEVYTPKINGGKGGFLWVKAAPLYNQKGNRIGAIEIFRDLQSVRNINIKSLVATLRERNFETEEHADRIQELIIPFGKEIGLPEYTLSALRLLAQFHDIGKVGTPDCILLKKGPLTPEETIEMHRHCEIGYRIARASAVLIPIADLIYKHHEWWNGKGYPLGLKEEEIPLECRILAIADAYDAMTSNRPYRKPLSKEMALKELKKYAGIQFDPKLVEIFLGLNK